MGGEKIIKKDAYIKEVDDFLTACCFCDNKDFEELDIHYVKALRLLSTLRSNWGDWVKQ